MKYVMLIYQGTTPLPGSEESATLSVEEQKQIYAERMANELRLPIVRLIEGSGGGGSVKSYESFKRTYVPANPGWDVVVDNMRIDEPRVHK